MNNSQTLFNDAFIRSRNEFLASLSPKERALFSSCQSPAQLIKDIERSDNFSKNSRRFLGSLEKVKQFTDRLEPYFEVIGIVVQSHPEVAAITWGAIRLILQLACNFATFFEKLAKALGTLANKFPWYERVQELLEKCNKQPSKRLGLSLRQIYVDMFNFFQGVARIFKKKDGTTRLAPAVAMDLMSKPFETRFKELLDRIGQHDQLIRDEIQIAQLELTMAQLEVNAEGAQRESRVERQGELREQINKLVGSVISVAESLAREVSEQQDKKFELNRKMEDFGRIKQWINPPEFSTDFHKHKDLRENETAEWLFREAVFKKWRSSKPPDLDQARSFSQQALWIRGNPGSGKSVLAASAIEELKNLQNSQCYYFFFRSESPTFDKREDSYRAILAQILQNHKEDFDIIEIFAFAIMDSTVGQMVASANELVDLLGVCLHAIGDCYIVLDGIDECGDNSVLVSDILAISKNYSAKILLFSRPNVISPVDALPLEYRLTEEATYLDIQLYFTHKLESLRELRLLPHDADLLELVNHLVVGAHGMFLWARLMINYLKSTIWWPEKRVKLILEVKIPDGLEKMYDRIIDLICRGQAAEQRLARWAIIWLQYSRRGVTALELRESSRVINMETEEEVNDEAHFEQSLLVVCACLVEKTTMKDPIYQRDTPSFRFIHLSVKEYLMSLESRQNSPINFSKPEVQLLLARACIQYLISCMPAQTLSGISGENISDSMLHRKYRLCNYAAIHWIDHFHDAVLSSLNHRGNHRPTLKTHYNDFMVVFSRFISNAQNITAWIEAHSIFGRKINIESLRKSSEVAVKNINMLSELPNQNVFDDASRLAKDLERLYEVWGPQLVSSPSCVWMECGAFTTSPFIVNTRAMEVHCLNPNSQTSNPTSKPLRIISETSSDGLHMSVLSVWPSRNYEKMAILTNRSLSCSKDVMAMLHRLSSGWVVRYQLHAIRDAPELLLDIQNPLDETKVWMQLQHSLWKDGKGTAAETCKLQFPVSISKCLCKFTVLRDVFILRPSTGGGGPTQHSLSLPLDFNKNVQQAWAIDFNDEGYRLDSWFHRNCKLYLFWIRLSTDGRFLFFMDKAASKPTNLAVYDLESLTSDSHPTLICSQSIDLYQGIQEFRTDAAAFHPTGPLVVFTVVGRVYLWPYRHPDHELQEIHYGLGCYESVTFSSCGNLVVINEVSANFPTIKPIPSDIRQLIASPMAVLDNDPAVSGGNKLQMQSMFPKPLGFNFISSTVIEGSQVNIQEGGGSKGITAVRSSDNVGVQVWDHQQQSGVHCSFEFMKIPKWHGIEDTSVSLLPEIREGKIRMVLNKAAQPWSNLSSSNNEENLPALISRDYKSINYNLSKTKVQQPKKLIDGEFRDRALGYGEQPDEANDGLASLEELSQALDEFWLVSKENTGAEINPNSSFS